jgi:hypothetical protein
MFSRAVGFAVIAIAVAGFAVLWWTITSTNSTLTTPPAAIVVFAGLPIMYSWQAPPLLPLSQV